MAITPKELIEKNLEGDRQKTLEIEEKIDALLLENYRGDGNPIEITAYALKRIEGTSSDLIEVAIENFKAAGWDIEKRADKTIFTAR